MALSLCTFNFFANMISAVYILYFVQERQMLPATLGLIFTLGSVGFAVGAMVAGRVAKRFGIGPTIVWGAGVSDRRATAGNTRWADHRHQPTELTPGDYT
jgi:MFS family permease